MTRGAAELLLLLLLLDQVIAERRSGSLKNVSLAEGISNPVELRLQRIEIAVQAELEYLVNGAELQFAHEPARELFGVIAEPGVNHTRNPTQRVIQFGDAETN